MSHTDLGFNITNPSEVFSCEFAFAVENIKTVLITQDSLETMGRKDMHSAKTPFLHVHAGYECFCCRTGFMQIHFEKEVVELFPGQMIIIAPKTLHSLKFFAEGTLSPAIMFQLSNNGLKVDVDMYGLLKNILPKNYGVYDLDEKMCSLFEAIAANAEERNLFSLSLQFHEFFSGLILMNNSVLPKYTGIAKDNTDIRLHRLFRFLLNEDADDCLDQAALELHLSGRQLSRIVRENYGCTFKELVARFRMEKAAILLIHTKMTVVDVAKNVGYNSVRGFYSAFKKRYGCLPAEYRKENSII